MNGLINNIIYCISGTILVLYAVFYIIKESYIRSEKETKNQNVDT